MEPIIGQAQSPTAAGPAVVEGSDATFEKDVLEASLSTPVVVDFWGPWCGPCKQLGPALEKAIAATNGAVKLVKIDIDRNPAIAGQMRVQSIPAVFGFVGGRPVDGFAGALPESQIKEFVQRLARTAGTEIGPDPVEEAMAQAASASDAGDYATAAAIFGQVVEHAPDNTTAIGRLAQAYLKLGEIEAARTVLDQIPEAGKDDAEVVSARAALDLAAKAGDAAANIAALTAKVQQNPNDHQARFDLADAQAAVGDHEEAIDNLLRIFQADRGWNDDAARLQLLKIFEALGPTDPLTLSGRRRLSSLLFS